MYQGETPTICLDLAPLLVEELDAAEIIVSIKAGSEQYDLTGERLTISGPLIYATLTQAETLKLHGRAKVQVNILTADGTRYATDWAAFAVNSNLYKEVMG